MPDIVWNGHSRAPVSLVLLPWQKDDVSGTTIATLDTNGVYYGARDVSFGPNHDGIVAAWVDGARGQGLAIDDRRVTA